MSLRAKDVLRDPQNSPPPAGTPLKLGARVVVLLAFIAALTGAGSLDVAPVVAASGCVSAQHCYSVAYELSHGTGYTGAKMTHHVLNLNHYGAPAFQPLWLGFANGDWVETGTSYENGLERNYIWVCEDNFCDYVWRLSAPLGATVYKIDQQATNPFKYDIYVAGTLRATVTMASGHGTWVGTGLETYAMNLVFPTFASYNLRYQLWGGAFQDWSGKDHQLVNVDPMCGLWASATSWWAGENTTCQ